MAAIVFLGCFVFYLGLMAPGIALEDSGELATAAVTLSLTHPPGYPLYLLAGKLFTLLPVGSPAFRLSLFSASCAATAVSLLFAIVRQLVPGRPLIAAASAFACAAVPALTLQATLADKYAMNLALLCALTLLMLRAWRDGPGRLQPIALIVGLSLAHHMQTLYLAPALAGLFWRDRVWRRRRTIMLFVLCVGLGLSLKAVALPLFSRATPSLMSGQLNTASKLGRYLSARDYSDRFSAFGVDEIIARLWTDGLVTIATQAGLPVLLFAALGAWYAWDRARPFLIHGLAAALLALGLVANFQIIGDEYYVLPVVAWLCALAALGIAKLAETHGRLPMAGALCLLVVGTLWRGLPAAVFSRYYGAMDWSRNLLHSVEQDAVLVTQRDDDFFPTMYLQRVLAERPDVILAFRYNLTRFSIHTEMQRLHPGFVMLDPKLIPWGRAVGPDSPLNFFLLSHMGRREVAFTYLASAETADGFLLTPKGCVFRVDRREAGGRISRASEFAAQLRRFRMRSVFAPYAARSRAWELAWAPSVLWAQLAVRWSGRRDQSESRACFRQAMRYPYTCVKQHGPGQWGIERIVYGF